MKKNKNLVVYLSILVIIIIIVLVILFHGKKEIIFNIPTNIEVKVGSNYSIEYELNSELDVIWESENNNIVTVNNGIINGIGLGSTKVNGTVTRNNEKITKSIDVSTYQGEKQVTLTDVIIPEGELFISKGTTYELPISYEPYNSYIKKIEYSVSNNNIVDFDGNIIAKEVGETDINIIVNDNITKTLKVNVVGEVINPTFTSRVNDIEIETDNITLTPGETKEIKYSVIPEKSYIKSIKWESNDSSIVDVTDGIVTAKASGEAIVKLVINDNITKEISVTVVIPVTGLTLKSNPNLVLKVGETETIRTSITPNNATNKTIKYVAGGGVSVDASGKITALAPSTGTIKVMTEDGNFSKTISYVVNPKTGLINSAAGVWGYTSPLDKVPNRMDAAFFQSLASNGKGTLSGDTYIYTDSRRTYKYNLTSSTLSADGRNVLTRIYYPPGVDLSEVNTFTFMGGTGERSLSGYFSHLDQNRTELKSSGIIALVSTKTSYYEADARVTTEFIKSIVGQKSGMKNSVGVYSMSGQCSGEAANLGIYDRLFIINSYVNYYEVEKLNIDIVIFSPSGDSMLKNTRNTLNNLYKYRNNRVTLITNNNELLNDERYTSQFLVINPGRQMGSGHGYVNISKANMFSYACK